MSLTASILIPTRDRTDYLRVALASIAPQAALAGAEVIVIDDGGADETRRELATRFAARYLAHQRPLGLNVARNTGVESCSGELVIFVDDDVQVLDGWLASLIQAAERHPEAQVLTGPIRPRLEGKTPRSCGREAAPITSLDLGDTDTWTRYAWGSNMAIRRAAFALCGPFDPSLRDGGDEQEWQDRLFAGRPDGVLYVAAAGLYHRRAPGDARLGRLMRAARVRGAAARRFDERCGRAPSRLAEMRTAVRCAGHVLRYRCTAGLVMVAHSWGRTTQALRGEGMHITQSEREDFLSGESGTIGGLDRFRRAGLDRLTDLSEIVRLRRHRLAAAARLHPSGSSVLAIGVHRPRYQQLSRAIAAELARSRHQMTLHTCPAGDLGKFENLNRLLAEYPPWEHDWLMVIDDDVQLPRGFVDRLLFIAERFSLDLCQPAHRACSHGAWRVTRRQGASIVRETAFVEIGPVTVFSRHTFQQLLPFPTLRMGWGLDLHWGALARENGWRCGVIDAVAIRHSAAPAAAAYGREEAIAEARRFLADHPYVTAAEAQRTLATHRRW